LCAIKRKINYEFFPICGIVAIGEFIQAGGRKGIPGGRKNLIWKGSRTHEGIPAKAGIQKFCLWIPTFAGTPEAAIMS
jgi:hypothetical protein